MKTKVIRALVVLLLSTPVASAQTLAEVLQKAIYTQETLGDIDGAIRIYQQLIAAAPPTSDIRAKAQRRLAEAEGLRRRTAARVPLATVDARVPLATLDGRTYRHVRTGLTFEVPAGWKVDGTDHSSDNGEMVTMTAVDPRAQVAVWMIPEKNDAESIAEKLDASPFLKAQARATYIPGYRIREGSVQRVSIGGQQAIVAIADYADGNGGRAMAEYMTWIYTERTHTFFFTHVPAEDQERHRLQFDALVYSAIIP